MALHRQIEAAIVDVLTAIAPEAGIEVVESDATSMTIRINGLPVEATAPGEPVADASLMQRAKRAAKLRFGPQLVIHAARSGRGESVESLAIKVGRDLIRTGEIV